MRLVRCRGPLHYTFQDEDNVVCVSNTYYIVFVDRIRATPEVPAHARSKAVPAHFDTVLVRTEEVNEHTRGTYLEGNTVFLGVLLNKADNSFKFLS